MEDDVKVFGFWIYLMTDLVIFSVLFSAFVVLRPATFEGPSGHQLFHLPFTLAETLILLTSSFTCSFATLAGFRQKKIPAIIWLVITFALGVAFLVLELSEFSDFAHRNASWERSAFLSSFFTLVGTHGFHITIGLLWMIVAIFRIAFRGLSPNSFSKVFRMALFWHFLDVVWIFIFTVVYGMGILL
jgi:cytochrome o ubiquinol oxidase subunit III